MKATVTFADGEQQTADDLADALRIISGKYKVPESQLVTDTEGTRTLVWLNEDDAKNDDGAKAAAVVTRWGNEI